MSHILRRSEGSLSFLVATKQSVMLGGRSSRRYSASPIAEASENPGSLKGLRVLDLSRVLAVSPIDEPVPVLRLTYQAPFCTQILADYGADVIKIETVGKGVGYYDISLISTGRQVDLSACLG